LIVFVYNKFFCFKTMQRIKCLKMRQGLKIIALISSKNTKAARLQIQGASGQSGTDFYPNHSALRYLKPSRLWL